MKIKKYSILTFIFGRYEKVREVTKIDPNAEYILVTDDKDLKSDSWNIIYDERLDNMSIIDKCYYVRYHPFEYCNTDLCFRIDGSIAIINTLDTIVDDFIASESDIMVMLNPVHNHLHSDYEQWVQTRNYPQESADKAMQLLYKLGYDSSYRGYYQIGLSLEKHNKLTEDLDRITYSILKYLGDENSIERFDQPIWSFVLNKFFEDKIKVMPVTEYLISCSKYFKWFMHNSNVQITYKTEQKPSYLFNKSVECVYYDKITPDTTDSNSFLLSEIEKLRAELNIKQQQFDAVLQSEANKKEQLNILHLELTEKTNLVDMLITENKNKQRELDILREEQTKIQQSKYYRLGVVLQRYKRWFRNRISI